MGGMNVVFEPCLLILKGKVLRKVVENFLSMLPLASSFPCKMVIMRKGVFLKLHYYLLSLVTFSNFFIQAHHMN